MLHPSDILNGRYEIIKVIGKGGMSTVYQARDLNTGRLLAIKDVDRSGTDTNQVVEQSLAAEGRMLMQLNNPHLPKIYDIIENPGNFMLVMDFIEGESLDHVLTREGAQPMARVLSWGQQICEVLSYLHNQPTPIIYRDMKPANVILQPNGQLMMIDFGTARTEKVGVQMQADTICIGTAGFAAPEQFGGIGQSTAKTDIFCLGATLYNMITGHSPCDHPTGILPLEKWNPALANTPIAYIIYKCTRNDPNERYQTAAQLQEDLMRAQDGTFMAQGRGKSGLLGRQGWQKQELHNTGGLSGLIQRGLSSTLNRAEKKPEPVVPQQQVNYQTAPQPAAQQIPWQTTQPAQTAIYPYAQQPAQSNWRKLMLIGVLLAAIFAVFAVALLVLAYTVAAAIFLLFAVIGAAMAVIGAVFMRRDQNG